MFEKVQRKKIFFTLNTQMSLIKIQSNTKVLFNDKVKTVPQNEESSTNPYTEIPLIEGENNVGTHGNTSALGAFPSITVPSLPYTIPSGVLKGLRITTTPTQPNDFLANANSQIADSLLIQQTDGTLRRFHFNSNTLTWNSGLRAISSIPSVAPDRQLRIVVKSGSTLRVWYKWNDGFWGV